MKKSIFVTFILVVTFVFPIMSNAMAPPPPPFAFPLPPPIPFVTPPELVIIPDTDIYAVPDFEDDLFFIRGGGGDTGMDAGTVHNGMTADGIIIPVIPSGLRSYRRIGEIITEAAGGMDIPGTLRGFIIGILTGIGVGATGAMIMVGDIPAPEGVREAVPTVVIMVRAAVRGSKDF